MRRYSGYVGSPTIDGAGSPSALGWPAWPSVTIRAMSELTRTALTEVATVVIAIKGAITDIRRYNPVAETWGYDKPSVDVGQTIGLRARITNTGSGSQRMRMDCLIQPPTAEAYTITGQAITLASGGYTDRQATWEANEAGEWKATLILYGEAF